MKGRMANSAEPKRVKWWRASREKSGSSRPKVATKSERKMPMKSWPMEGAIFCRVATFWRKEPGRDVSTARAV